MIVYDWIRRELLNHHNGSRGEPYSIATYVFM